jgi:hypothetical protein
MGELLTLDQLIKVRILVSQLFRENRPFA